MLTHRLFQRKEDVVSVRFQEFGLGNESNSRNVPICLLVRRDDCDLYSKRRIFDYCLRYEVPANDLDSVDSSIRTASNDKVKVSFWPLIMKNVF
jgi:hypothetical protein